MKSLSLVIVAMLYAGHVAADVVVLNNGDRLSGTVDSIAGGHVLLNTTYAGHVSIESAAIAQLVTQESFEIQTSQGRSEGRFEVIDGHQSLVAADSTSALVLDDVKTAGINKLSLQAFVPDWKTRADLASKISTGNTDTESYSTLVESNLKKEFVEHNIRLLVSQEEADKSKTKDELDLDYAYKRFISEKWYVSGNGEYFEDPIKNVDSRITLSGGMGYQFWDDSFGSLSSDIGLSAVHEDLDGDASTNPAIRWGLAYKRFLLAKKLEAFHQQSVLVIPDPDRGEVLASSTGLRYALNSRVDAMVRVDVNHETKPAPEASKTDLTYSMGVGIKF